MTRTLLAIAVVVVTFSAQAGAVAGPVTQQATPDGTPDGAPATPTDRANETPDGAPVTPADGTTPSVTFDDQETDGRTVTVSNVTLTEGGYVVISEGNVSERGADSVVGTSDYLPGGEYNSVTITLFEVPGTANETGNATANQTDPGSRDRLAGSGTLTATVHAENSGNRSLDYVASSGLVDVPVLVDGGPVTDTATVTVVDGNETTPDGETPADPGADPPATP